MSNARFGLRTKSGQISSLIQSSSFDAYTLAFISAAGITDSTQQSAINTMVVDLKSNSIWNKLYAIYPFVGGTSNSHKYNLKNALDTDAAFRLVFSGGWIHSSTGATPNGVNSFANTFLNANTTLQLNSTSIHYYSRTSTGDSATEMGVDAGGVAPFLIIATKQSSVDYSTAFSAATGATAQASSLGLFSVSRTASNAYARYKNGTSYLSASTASTSKPNNTIYIGARNQNGTAAQYTTYQCAFSAVADGLTAGEMTTFYNIIQAYQTTLGRQV